MFLSLAEAAALGPWTPKQLAAKMHDGTLIEGVHWHKPHGIRPILVREAFMLWLTGRDEKLRDPAPRSRRGRCNFAALDEAI